MDDWKDKIDLVKLSLKDSFADKKTVQNFNNDLGVVTGKLENLTKTQQEMEEWKKMMKEAMAEEIKSNSIALRNEFEPKIMELQNIINSMTMNDSKGMEQESIKEMQESYLIQSNII